MNQAHRLHDTLERFRKFEPNLPFRSCVAKLFNIDSEKSPQVIIVYTRLLSQAVNIKETLFAIPGINTSLYSKSITSIIVSLAKAPLDRETRVFNSLFTDKDLHGLEFIANALDEFESEQIVQDEKLVEFENDLVELIEELKASDFDSHFKHLAMDNLLQLLNAVKRYQFFGADEIRDKIYISAGGFVLDPRTDKSHVQEYSFLKKAMNLIKRINDVMDFVRHGTTILNDSKLVETLFLQK